MPKWCAAFSSSCTREKKSANIWCNRLVDWTATCLRSSSMAASYLISCKIKNAFNVLLCLKWLFHSHVYYHQYNEIKDLCKVKEDRTITTAFITPTRLHSRIFTHNKEHQQKHQLTQGGSSAQVMASLKDSRLFSQSAWGISTTYLLIQFT